MHVPGPTDFKDLKNVNGHICGTYTEACQKLGLLESDEIFKRAMEDAVAEKMSNSKLQHYFAMLIVHAQPSDPQALFDAFLNDMNPPFSTNHPDYQPKSIERRRAEVMRNLEYFFNCFNSSSK